MLTRECCFGICSARKCAKGRFFRSDSPLMKLTLAVALVIFSKGLPALQTFTLENIGWSDTDLAKPKADLPPELIAKWETQREKTKAAKK
jgi:hypothetical protein